MTDKKQKVKKDSKKITVVISEPQAVELQTEKYYIVSWLDSFEIPPINEDALNDENKAFVNDVKLKIESIIIDNILLINLPY